MVMGGHMMRKCRWLAASITVFVTCWLFGVDGSARRYQNTGAEGGTTKPGVADAGTSQHPAFGPARRTAENPLTIVNFGTANDIQQRLGTSPSDANLIIDHRPYDQLTDLQKVLSRKSYRRILRQVRSQPPR